MDCFSHDTLDLQWGTGGRVSVWALETGEEASPGPRSSRWAGGAARLCEAVGPSAKTSATLDLGKEGREVWDSHGHSAHERNPLDMVMCQPKTEHH